MDIKDLRIAVLIPHRGDRELLLRNCFRMLDAQTLQATYVCLEDYEPESVEKDITQRYKRGYNKLSKWSTPFDFIALWENDDYYAPNYLEVMATEWLRAGRPDIMGTNYTIYHHLKLRKYFTMQHPKRASAMNTIIKPGLQFPWCADNYAFTDLHLWNMTVDRGMQNAILKGHLFKPEKIISIGMKHGIGLCGGRNHNDRLERFNVPDADLKFLKENCDSESFKFYAGF